MVVREQADRQVELEEQHGGLESLLVTAVEFRESKVAPGTSKAMQEATCRKAEEAVAAVQPEKVVHYQGLRRPITIALALVLLIAAFIPDEPLLGPFLNMRAAVLLGLYALGVVAAVGTAFLLKRTLLKAQPTSLAGSGASAPSVQRTHLSRYEPSANPT